MSHIICQNETTIEQLKMLENLTGNDKNDFIKNTLNPKENERGMRIVKVGRIYLITNITNNKRYVGITTKTINQRFGQHVRQAKKSIKNAIHLAIQKYGKDKFRIELIEELKNINQDELFLKESYYIEKFNTWVENGMGYNIEKISNGKLVRGGNIRKTMSELKGERNRNADLTIRHFKNVLTNEEFHGNRHAFREKYNLKKHGIDNLIGGWKSSLKGWVLCYD